MGKATIISGGANGRYKIIYHVDRTRIQAQIDAITLKIEDYETGLIPAFETDEAAKQADLNARLADLNAAIDADADPQPATAAVMASRDAHTQAVNALDTAKMELTAIKFRKVQLEQILPPASYETSAWCADLNENLSGDVGVIEVPGERAMIPVIIKPAGEDGTLAAYIQHKDGIMVPVPSISPEIFFYNLAMFPAWQKWMPGYRLGTITSINTTDGDLCSVTLDSATSTQQGLDINKTTSLTNVPIVYMSCNGDAFEVGDRVVIKYTGSGPGTEYTPTVIGFESNPRICCNDFSALPLTGAAPLEVGFTFIFNIDAELPYTQRRLRFLTWDFGNDAYSDKIDIDDPIPFTYETPGDYTVKAMFADTAMWQDLRTIVVSNIRGEEKLSAFQSTEAAAWSSYTGASWATKSMTTPSAEHFLSFTGGNYRYRSRRYTIDIDLTSYDNSNPIFYTWAFANGGAGAQLFNGVKISFIDPVTTLPIQRTLDRIGAMVRAVTGDPIPLYRPLDLTPYAGMTLTDVLVEDNSGFSRAPIITWSSSTLNGWGSLGGRIITRILPAACTVTKTNYITVT